MYRVYPLHYLDFSAFDHYPSLMQTIFLLNAGTATRRAFMEGADDTPVQHLKTKNIVLFLGFDEPITFLHKGTTIDFSGGIVFNRLRANDALFCGILYEHLEHIGVSASDPISLAFPNAEEKIAQMARFVRAGVPIPKTIIAREEGYQDNREYILAALSFPLVFKLDGSQGNRVHKIATAEELDAAVASKPKHERFLLQELIPNSYDTRTLVAYDTILGSIKRIGTPGSFLNNVSKGANVEPHELTEAEIELARRACVATRIDFGGVDMIKTETGHVVIEVNKSPQIAGFERVFGKNYVFRTIAQILKKRL